MRILFTVPCLVVGLILVTAGCSSESSSSRGEAATYTSRGEVVEIEAGSVVIHHETIPEFVASDGEVMPMEAHAMGFIPAQGVSIKDIAVGDKVEFSFDVWWQPMPDYELTRIAKLPDDTELDIQVHASDPHDHAGHAH